MHAHRRHRYHTALPCSAAAQQLHQFARATWRRPLEECLRLIKILVTHPNLNFLTSSTWHKCLSCLFVRTAERRNRNYSELDITLGSARMHRTQELRHFACLYRPRPDGINCRNRKYWGMRAVQEANRVGNSMLPVICASGLALGGAFELWQPRTGMAEAIPCMPATLRLLIAY